MLFRSANPEQTVRIGRALGQLLSAGDVVALDGELGAGKTLMAKGIAAAKGVDPDMVTSPTFALVNQYDGVLPVYHLDVYRLDSVSDLENIGYEEYVYGHGITIIEWAEKIESVLPPVHIRVTIIGVGSGEREITIDAVGGPGVEEVQERLAALEELL